MPCLESLVLRGGNGSCQAFSDFIKRHTRANPQKNVKGGIVEREAPVHASNVQIVCPECGKPTRAGHRKLDDGTRVRICRKCEGVIDK